MEELFTAKETKDIKIKEINKFNRLVKVIDNLSEEDVLPIKQEGIIEEEDDIVIKQALKYFISVLSFDDEYIDYDSFSAYEAFKKSKRRNTDIFGKEDELINEGLIDGLYDNMVFYRRLEVLRNKYLKSTSLSLLRLISEDPGNKETLATLKSINDIAKKTEEKLEEKKEILLVHLIPEEFYNSHTLLINKLNEAIGSIEAVNFGLAQKIKKEINEDEYIKENQILIVEQAHDLSIDDN